MSSVLSAFGNNGHVARLDDIGVKVTKKGEEITGTTIMAIKYKGGVILAADSRTSAGSFVVNRMSDKLTHISDNIFCCRSGSSADTQAIADIVRYNIEFHKSQINYQPLVKSAVGVFQNLLYKYRDRLSASVIIAGWDKINGPQVYCIPIGGLVISRSFAIGGSGSTFIYGMMDSNYKEDMTKQECIDFAKKAISLAILRDGSSGGVIRMVDISETGVERHLFTQEGFQQKFDFHEEMV